MLNLYIHFVIELKRDRNEREKIINVDKIKMYIIKKEGGKTSKNNLKIILFVNFRKTLRELLLYLLLV